MDRPDEDHCVVVLHHMMTLLGMATYTVGCEHRGLAVATEAWLDSTLFVTLTLDSHQVVLKFQRNHLPRIANVEHGDEALPHEWRLPDNA